APRSWPAGKTGFDSSRHPLLAPAGVLVHERQLGSTRHGGFTVQTWFRLDAVVDQWQQVPHDRLLVVAEGQVGYVGVEPRSGGDGLTQRGRERDDPTQAQVDVVLVADQ